MTPKVKYTPTTQVFYDNSGNIIFTIDRANRKVTYPASAQLDMSAAQNKNGHNPLVISRFKWDFATDGGVKEGITFRGDLLPVGAVVTHGALYVKTALGGATNASIQLTASNDIVTAAAISGSPWNANTTLRVIAPVLSDASTWVTIASAAKAPQLVGTVANFNAGSLTLVLCWFMID